MARGPHAASTLARVGAVRESREPGLRVLIVCAGHLEGSSEKHALAIAAELCRQGHYALVSLADGPPAETGEPGRGIPWVRAHRVSARGLRATDQEAARRFAPDVVHAFSSRVPVLSAARGFAAATGAPLSVHFEDDEWGLLSSLYAGRAPARLARKAASRVEPRAWPLSTRRSLSWTARHADGLDALTPALAAEVQRRLERPCAAILPPSPPTPPARAALALPPALRGRELLVFAGSVTDATLPDTRIGIRATAELQRRGRRIAMAHAGAASARLALHELAAEARLEHSTLHSYGYLEPAAYGALLAMADVLVQPGPPSDFNRLRLPSKLQSYLPSGTPTVTFAVGFGELLDDRAEVLKTHGAEPGELADRIAELLDDRVLAERVAAGGRSAARRLFDPERNVGELASHLREVISSRSAGGRPPAAPGPPRRAP